MSRSGYSDDIDDQWALIRWRGAVTSAIKGKRGQSFLKELENVLLSMPNKRLIANSFGRVDGEVCALGSVAFARAKARLGDEAKAITEVNTSFQDQYDSEGAAAKLGISEALAKEIMFMNDDDYGCFNETPEIRYSRMLEWVRFNLKEEKK